MKRYQVVGLVFFALVIGFGLGLNVARQKSWKQYKSGKMKTHMLEKFSRTLELTETQKESVKVILDAKQQQLRALRQEMHPRFEELRAQTREKILPLLSDEQKVKFDVMEKEFEAKRRKWKDKHLDSDKSSAPVE